MSRGFLLALWDKFADAMTYSVFPVWVAELADQEREADVIRWFSWGLVPGVLQTEDYARGRQARPHRLTGVSAGGPS